MLPLRHAAKAIGVHINSVQYYHSRGLIPTVRIGRYECIDPYVLQSVLSALGYRSRRQK